MLFGCFASTGPAATGIIRDNFGPGYRASANSIFLSAGFLGGGIASLSIQLIEKYGWKFDYDVIGVTGIILGIICLTLLEEPKRGQYDDLPPAQPEPQGESKDEKGDISEIGDVFKEFLSSGKELFEQNPCAKWLLPGALIRYGGYFCLLFYIPVAFTKTYPENIDDFSTINAFINIVVANGSALLGGYLSDKVEKDTYWAKPGIVMATSLISAPLICTGLLSQDNFAFSMTMLCLHFLFA